MNIYRYIDSRANHILIGLYGLRMQKKVLALMSFFLQVITDKITISDYFKEI
jgi:hypothetical protein